MFFVIYFLVNCIILISGKCIWTSSSVEDYKTGKYLEYNFPKEIKDYFPSYDDIKDDSIILEFEGYDANYNSPSLFQNKLNSYCKVAILYDEDLYENVKNKKETDLISNQPPSTLLYSVLLFRSNS